MILPQNIFGFCVLNTEVQVGVNTGKKQNTVDKKKR
jgi:hypothetical protein